MGSTIRSFIAVELAAEQTRAVARILKQLAQNWPEYRWADPQNLHLTVNFLGDVPDEKIPRICQILREGCAQHPPFQIELSNLGAFPRNQRPRVIWIGVDNGKSPLSRLHYDLAQQWDLLRLERDRKSYRPHLTLGRIRDQHRWPDSMIEYLEGDPKPGIDPIEVSELVLFASHREKSGAIHTVMDRVPLGGD